MARGIMLGRNGRMVLICIFIPFWLVAQSEQDIKLSGEYYWGEGEHKSEEQARNLALQDMLFKIQVTVSSEVMTKEEQVDERYTEEARSLVRASTTLSLQGVDFLTKSRKGNRVVIAYISKENYRKSIAAVSAEISGLVKSIEVDEQRLGLGNLIENYYLAYLRAFQCPEPIQYTTLSGQQYPNVQMFLKNKIETWLTGLTVTPGKIIVDASIPMMTIPVNVSDQGKPASKIIAKLNTTDAAEMEVIDGKVQFFRYLLPSAMHENLDVILAVNLDRQKTREDLYQLHESFKITQPKKIELDYSGLVRLGFNVYSQVSGALLFKPVYTNLSVADLVWDFGDGETSSQQNPLHKYVDQNDHIVTLTFNNNQDLTLSKRVSPDGKTAEIVKEEKPPVSKVQESTPVAEEKKPWSPSYASPVLADLANCQSYQDLAGKLEHFKKQHKLIYGKADTFVKPENCYIFIIHPQSKTVVAVLDKGKGGRLNLKTGEIITDLSAQYRGMISIYTEVY